MLFDWKLRSRTDAIVIHAVEFPEEGGATAWLRLRARRNGMLELGYHYVIERSGEARVVRPFTAQGSHTPGRNHDTIGIALAATIEDKATEAQLIRAADLCATMRNTYRADLPILTFDEAARPARPKGTSDAIDMVRLRELAQSSGSGLV